MNVVCLPKNDYLCKKYIVMTLIDFISQFPNEESCKQKFEKYRDHVGVVLPWVHITISNAKRQLLNTFHDIKPEFLQNYLDEFCYKFNRRYFGEALFGRLLIAVVSYKNEFRYKYG